MIRHEWPNPARLKVFDAALAAMEPWVSSEDMGLITGMFESGHHQVTMDFVGKHQDIVLQADIAEPFKFIVLPDPAHGIVRRAQDGKLYPWILNFFFQVFKVHVISIVVQHQGVFNHLPAIGADGLGKGIVHGTVESARRLLAW